MFTWKRLFLSLGFLFLVFTIGWTTWYFTIVRPKLIAEPVIRYNTKSQITMDDTSDAAVAGKSHIRKNTQENGTAETHKDLKDRSQSAREGNKNATASLTQKESDKHTEHPDKSNGKKLSDEELAKRKADAERIIKHFRTQIDELRYSTNELKKESERFKASYNENEMRAKLVKRLNSLSAEEQKAYFEDIKSGKAVDNFLETFRTGLTEKGIPNSFTEVFLELLKPQFSGESYAEKHLEELRAHGFEPKF